MHDTDPAEIIIGIDTHKEAHAAVAINGLGSRLSAMTLPASHRGYQELEAWALSLGHVRSFGIEGTGSYGAGLSRFLQERGHNVIEVNHPIARSNINTARLIRSMLRTRPAPFSVARPVRLPSRAPARSR